jgi:Lysyl oxidase
MTGRAFAAAANARTLYATRSLCLRDAMNQRYSTSTIGILAAALSFSLAGSALAQTGPCGTIIAGQPLPDLIVDANYLKFDAGATVQNFSQTECAVVEGCVSSRGSHTLLHFTSLMPNVGQGDLVIGDPAQCPSLFHQSECHGHLHFKEYADYRLWTLSGYANWVANRQMSQPTDTGINATLLASARQTGALIEGRKQGFCIIDLVPYSTNPPPAKYTECGALGHPGNQGLQVGWADSYTRGLDCQFIQIDGLRRGTYVLENHVNPEQLLPESNYMNNSAAVQFDFIPKRGKTPPQVLNLIIR